MSGVIESLEREQLRRRPAFQAGDRVKVHFQVVEGNRRRTQVFEGVVIKLQGAGARETFTVRKHSFGVGVERTFPLHSPKVERIEVAGRGDVRRAKLYYLRGRVGRRARVRERQYAGPLEDELEGEQMADTAGGQEDAPPVADEDGSDASPDGTAEQGQDVEGEASQGAAEEGGDAEVEEPPAPDDRESSPAESEADDADTR